MLYLSSTTMVVFLDDDDDDGKMVDWFVNYDVDGNYSPCLLFNRYNMRQLCYGHVGYEKLIRKKVSTRKEKLIFEEVALKMKIFDSEICREIISIFYLLLFSLFSFFS
jgi:hypothetical protein